MSVFSLTKTSCLADSYPLARGQLVTTGTSPMTLHPTNANNKIGFVLYKAWFRAFKSQPYLRAR